MTGDSKGYGLIKYVSREAAEQARLLLDGRAVGGSHVAECDWLSASRITFASLHSKALYVENLPPGYRDVQEYKRIFSAVLKPPYCQIVMVKGVIQDWGLVEFEGQADAEETQRRTNGYLLQGYPLRVHYCVPGTNAINIFMQVRRERSLIRIILGTSCEGGCWRHFTLVTHFFLLLSQAVNAPAGNKRKALLNDTPSANVYSQLQKLAQQNPNCELDKHAFSTTN